MKQNWAKTLDPYQVLFPLGLAHALWGAVLWILFAVQRVPYPGLAHAHHMSDGFLFSFATGFLLTAVPRFTGTARCSPLELAIATGIATFAFFDTRATTGLAILIFLLVFFLRRFKKRTFSPPPHFIFLPLGLVLGIVGSAAISLGQMGYLDAQYLSAGRILLYQGTMLSFLLGIGAKLISALLGWASPPTHQIASAQAFKRSRSPIATHAIPATQAALFLISFPTEIFVHPLLGRALRAGCATWIGFQNWKVYRRPRAQGKLAFWLWMSAWALLVGLWTHALFPNYGVHAAHLIFVSGLGVLTLLVASRVILAHGNYPLNLESKSRVYAFTAVLIFIAAVTRFAAPWVPASYFAHLAYAAGSWILAVILWSAFFVPKILIHSK